MIRWNLPLFALLAVSACAPTIANRGQMVDAEKVAAIEVGSSTREDVVALIGSPTQVATFDENSWYYFGQTTEQYSFFSPTIIKHNAYEVRFDDDGLVTHINEMDKELAQTITPVSRRTPTYGHRTTFVEQLVGNLGRPAARERK